MMQMTDATEKLTGNTLKRHEKWNCGNEMIEDLLNLCFTVQQHFQTDGTNE